MPNARYRTIKESLAWIKARDPNTAISETFLRGLCKRKSVTSFSINKKILLNFDELIDYLHIGGEESD
jgi:hypothetical protein